MWRSQVSTAVGVRWTAGQISLNQTWTHSADAFVVNASVVMTGSGALDVAGPSAVLSIAGMAVMVNVPVSVTNGATLQTTAETLSLGGGGVWNATVSISSGILKLTQGTFAVQSTAVWEGSSAGLSVKGTAFVLVYCLLKWPESFVVSVGEAGTLTLLANASVSGPLTVADTASLLVAASVAVEALALQDNAVLAVANATLEARGLVQTGGVVDLGTGGALLLTGNCSQSGGQVAGAGAVEAVAGTWSVSGGAWSGTGSVVVAAPARLELAPAVPLSVTRQVSHALCGTCHTPASASVCVQVTTSGEVAWSSGDVVLQSAWSHQNGKSFMVTADGGSLTGAGSILLAGTGTMLLVDTADVVTIGTTLNTEAQTTVAVMSGRLLLIGTGLWTGTASTASADATLELRSAAAGYTLSSTASLTGTSGQVVVSGGVVTVNTSVALTAGVACSVTGGRLVLGASTVFAPVTTVSGGQLSVAADVNVSSTLDVSGDGAVAVGPGSTLRLGGGGSWSPSSSSGVSLGGAGAVLSFVNGTYSLDSASALSGSTGQVQVTGAAAVTVTAALAVTAGATCAISDGGTLTLSAGAASLSPAVTVSASGTLRVTTNVSLPAAGGLVVASGGSAEVVAGTLSVLGGCRIDVGGAVNVNTGAQLTVANGCRQLGGTIDGAGLVVANGGVYEMSGGSWTGSGIFRLVSTGTLALTGSVSLARSVRLLCLGNWVS